MARETKQQRFLRVEQEKFDVLQREIADYPARLMTMLERACNANFQLDVRVGEFVLSDRDDPNCWFSLTRFHDPHNVETLNELECRIDVKEKAEQERLRQRAIRSEALAKLTPEEKKVLGL